MGTLYFSTEWLVLLTDLPGNVLLAVNNLCRDLNCSLLVTGGRKTEEGYYVAQYVIRAPSMEKFEEFVDKAKRFMEFKNIQEVTEEKFAGGPLIPQVHIMESTAALQRTSDYNRTLLSKTV